MKNNHTLLKRIEFYLRRKIQAFFENDSSTIVVTSPFQAFDTSKSLKILFLRHNHLGDAIVSVPLIREIRQQYPHFELQIVLGKSNFVLAPFLHTYTDKEWKYSKKFFDTLSLLRKLRSEKFDIIIDIYDKSSVTSTLLIWLIRSKFAIGLATGSSKVLTHRVDRGIHTSIHVVHLYMLPLLAFGIDPTVVNSYLEFPKNLKILPQKNRVFINLNGSQRIRYWGTENFISLIQEMENRWQHLEIVVSCTKDYDTELQQILSMTKAIHCGYTSSFLEYTDEIAKSTFVITPDTVVPHICDAWNISCVVLYLLEESYILWRPRTTKYEYTISPDKNMTSIAVENVMNSFQRLYDSVNQSQ